MTKEIKYCLAGAIISFLINGILDYMGVTNGYLNLVKTVYIGFTIGLVYYVIRLLSTAEISNNN